MADSEAPSPHPTRQRGPPKQFEQEPITTHKKRAPAIKKNASKAPVKAKVPKGTSIDEPKAPKKRGPYKKKKAVETASQSSDSAPNGQPHEQPTFVPVNPPMQPTFVPINPPILKDKALTEGDANIKSEPPAGPIITAPVTAENPVILDDAGVTSAGNYPWTSVIEEAFLQTLLEARGLGLQNGNGWKTKAFKMCVARLNELFFPLLNISVTTANLHSKWGTFKGTWKDFLKHEAHISGWGPNRDVLYGDIGIPVSDEETMKAHFKQFGACKKFKTRFPAHKELLEQLIGDRLADGRHATGLQGGKVAKSEELEALMEGRDKPERSVIKRKERDVEHSPEALAKRNKIDSRVEAMNNSAQKMEKLVEVMSMPRVTPLALAMRKVNEIFFEDSITCRELWFYLMRDPVKVDFFNGLKEDKDLAWFINDCLGREVLTENCKVKQLEAEIMAMEGSDDEDVVFESDDEVGHDADEVEDGNGVDIGGSE